MRTDTKTKTPPNLLLNLQCWNFSPVSAGRWGVSGASKEQEKFGSVAKNHNIKEKI